MQEKERFTLQLVAAYVIINRYAISTFGYSVFSSFARKSFKIFKGSIIFKFNMHENAWIRHLKKTWALRHKPLQFSRICSIIQRWLIIILEFLHMIGISFAIPNQDYKRNNINSEMIESPLLSQFRIKIAEKNVNSEIIVTTKLLHLVIYQHVIFSQSNGHLLSISN